MLDELKNKANPHYGLVDEMRLLKEANNENSDVVIKLLVALCDSNDEIVKYKEEQKQGDIKYRKKSNIQNMIGILIAMLAVYISIKGYGGSFLALIGIG